MKQYTRRDALKLFGIGTAAVAGLGLTGCNGLGEGTGGGAQKSSEPMPASRAFAQASVWLEYNSPKDGIGKDVSIYRFLFFDGKGNVTTYLPADARFRDLKGLSGEEIVKFATKQDKAKFEAEKKHAIENANEDVENYQNLDSSFAETLELAKQVLAFEEAAQYSKPKAHPYTLELETDESGNSTASEKLRFKARSFVCSDITAYNVMENNVEIPKSAIETYDDDIELGSATTATVYNTTFAGYAGLVTVVNEGFSGFTWDTPDTEGIEVD